MRCFPLFSLQTIEGVQAKLLRLVGEKAALTITKTPVSDSWKRAISQGEVHPRNYYAGASAKELLIERAKKLLA